MRLATQLFLAAVLLVIASDVTFAQGRGRGAGGAGGFGGGGFGGGGPGPAGGSFDHGGRFGGRDSAEFGGHAFGDRPAMNDGAGHGFGGGRSDSFGETSNAERIRDHREDVADHVRTNAERNGNERLYGTADRMDASAQQNYDRQSEAVPADGQNANAVARRPEWATSPDAARAQAAEHPTAEPSRRWRPGSGLRRLWPFGGRD